MTYARAAVDNLARLPSWVTGLRCEAPEDVAFLSGAALSHLHLVLGQGDVPHALLRDRLALRAAEACVGYSGRPERAAELRDAVHFLRPGDHPGPAGESYLCWRRGVARPVTVPALHRALPHLEPDRIHTWLDAGRGAPIRRAAAVLEAVLQEGPRAQTQALLLADAALAQALGGRYVVPLLGCGLRRRDLRASGDDLCQACHRAIVSAVVQTIRTASDLTRRAARLRALAPKLRARGAEAAVAVFLTRDAVAPAALTALQSDRARRRFCDRLVELGVVTELTGRDTFRLFGV